MSVSASLQRVEPGSFQAGRNKKRSRNFMQLDWRTSNIVLHIFEGASMHFTLGFYAIE